MQRQMLLRRLQWQWTQKARATFEGQSSDRIAKSDVVKDTMSATLKLAKEIDEPDIRQSTADCHLMAWPCKEKAGYNER